MKEQVRTRGRDKDCDKQLSYDRDCDGQLSYDRDLGQGTRQGSCRGTRHEDRVQDGVCLRTQGLSVGLS